MQTIEILVEVINANLRYIVAKEYTYHTFRINLNMRSSNVDRGNLFFHQAS